VAIGLSGWQMYRQYHATLARQRQYLSRKVTPPLPPILTLPADAPPTQATAYYEIAAQLPFSPDRNPTVVVEVAAPKPMPALPGYHGMMNFGEGPRVILSTSGVPQRSYQVGQTIGDFKLVAVAQSGLVFEWDGKQVPAGYAELAQRARESAPAQAQPTSAPVSASPAPRSSTTAVTTVGARSSESVPGSGGSLMSDTADSQGMRECKAGDNTPEGTIVNGFKKLTTSSPFGTICRWVPAK
jgi:hypothetical protein